MKTKSKKAAYQSRLNRKDLWICVAVFTLALLVRLVHLYEVSKSPTFLTPIIDSGEYERYARLLAGGKGMVPEFFWQGFFYPFFLFLVYMICGISIVSAKVIQVVLGSVVCVLAYILGKKIFDRRTAIAAGVITALYGPLVFFDSQLLSAGWACFWAVVLCLLFIKAEKPTTALSNYFLLGLCGGLSIITHATFVPFVVFTSAWIAVPLRRASMAWSAIAKRQLLILAAVAVILLPVSLQCYRLTGRFSPLPETGAINLYMGNNSQMHEIMAIRPGSKWSQLLLLPRLHGAKNKQDDQRFFARQVRKYILTEPGHFIFRLGRKAVHFFSSREIPSNLDIYGYRKYSKMLSLLTWKIGKFGFPFGVLLPLALLGLLRRRGVIAVPVLLFLILYPLAIILVFVTGRYRAVMIPVVAVPAAAGLLELVDAIKGRHCYQAFAMSALVIVVAAISSLAGPFAPEKLDYEQEMYYCLGCEYQHREQPDQSIDYFNEALRLDPCDSDAYRHIGLALIKKGRPEQALSYYRKACQIDPEYVGNYFGLGLALQHSGKPEEAIDNYLEAIRLDPVEPEIYQNLGSVYGQLKKPEEAIKYFTRALQLNPKSDSCHYNLAIALLQIGKPDQARQHLKTSLYYAQLQHNQSMAARIEKELRNIENPQK